VITANGPTTFCNGGSVLLNSNVPNPNNSLSFVKANSQYITVPHSASINLLGTFTMEAWVNYSGINCTIVDKGDYDFLWELNANGNANKLGFYMKNTNTWVYSAGAVPQNTWTHVAITLNAGTLTFFINGVVSGTSNPVTNLQDTQPMNIGRQQPTFCACNHFNGKMDELRLWNIVKTPTQIQADMSKIIPANSAGLVAYYRFDEVSGNTATDATVNANNGTLMNSPTWDSPPTTTPINTPNYWLPNGATTQFVGVNTGGTYTSIITNEYGCTNSASVVVNNLNPTVPTPQGSVHTYQRAEAFHSLPRVVQEVLEHTF
jgi:Concanavalin A-like lectin/glucanases superfamily